MTKSTVPQGSCLATNMMCSPWIRTLRCGPYRHKNIRVIIKVRPIMSFVGIGPQGGQKIRCMKIRNTRQPNAWRGNKIMYPSLRFSSSRHTIILNSIMTIWLRPNKIDIWPIILTHIRWLVGQPTTWSNSMDCHIWPIPIWLPKHMRSKRNSHILAQHDAPPDDQCHMAQTDDSWKESNHVAWREQIQPRGLRQY